MGEEEEETLGHQGSLASLLVFMIVISFQLVSIWLEHLKKRGPKIAEVLQLQVEIKQLLKEASFFSEPSTFAQAAKLRRLAAAKEKELANYQESRGKEMRMSYGLHLKVLFLFKVLTYFVLVCWFWGVPVAIIPEQLVQPFGRVLSWRTGGISNNNVKVVIIPWLLLSTRVSKLACQTLKSRK